MSGRRGFLTGAAALVVPIGTTAAAAAGTRHPDAELIALCARFVALEDEVRRTKGCGDERYYSTIKAIEETPALTDAGNMAKLAAVAAWYEGNPPEEGSLLAGALWQAITALARLPAGAGETT